MGVLQRIALCYFFASILIKYLSTKTVVVVSILLLLGYWFLLLLFSSHGDPYGMINNAGTQLDKYIFGDNHLYHGEGLLSSRRYFEYTSCYRKCSDRLLCRKIYKRKGRGYQTTTGLFVCGAVLILLALVWNNFFPVNKKLWSGSFVLLTAGLDLSILGGLIYSIEIRKVQLIELDKIFHHIWQKPPFHLFII